jgi:hypothetical protein
MEEALYSSTDFILMPIYLLVFFFIAQNIQRKNIGSNPLYKYYVRGLFAKFAGGFIACMLYLFYYGGGDTLGYFVSGKLVAEMGFVNQETFFSVLAGNLSNENLMRFIENDLCCPDYYRDPQSFTVVRFAAPLILLGGFSYFTTTFFFAFLSYGGIWRLFLLFNELYPGMEKKFSWAILFMPSLLFWGSAILKDTITFSAACWVTYCIYQIFIIKNKRIKYSIYLVIASFVIISIKAYIFVALVPGATIWILYDRIKSIKSAFFRILIAPLIIGIGILGSSFLLSSLGSSLGAYGSIDKAIDKALVTKNDLTRDAYGQNSFDIGEMDGSIGSIISKFPIALTAGLFRPFLWDVRNPVMLISALENTFLILLTFRVFFRLGPIKVFRTIFSNPLLIFSFVFVIFFSFSVGLSTANFGALVRYKIPSIPFFMGLLMILDEVKIREIMERKKLRQAEEELERAELAKLLS